MTPTAGLLLLLATLAFGAEKEQAEGPSVIQQHYDTAFKDYSNGDYPRAIEHWQEILKLDPEQASAKKMIGVARNQIALQEKAKQKDLRAHVAKGQYKAALLDLESLIGRDPKNPSYRSLQERLEGVAEICPQAPGSDKPWRLAILGVEDYLENPDRPSFAYDALRYARELDPEEKRFKRLEDLVLAAQPALADDKIPSGMRLLDYKLYISLNDIYDGKYHLAVETLEKLLRLEPDNLLALKRLGSAYFALGRAKEAREVWLRALELAPKDAQLKKFIASTEKNPLHNKKRPL